MNKCFKLLIFFSLFSVEAMAFTELSVEGSYSKKVFGSNRQNDLINQTYSGTIAFYLFSYTAIEFNYMKSDEETTERTEIETTEESVIFKGYTTNVENEVMGVGIRQALAGRKSAIRPLISIGYAKQKVSDSTEYRYELESTGQQIRLKSATNTVTSDSVFGSFSLQFNLTQRMKVSASVRTVFPAFDFEQAQDYLKYTLGLTWLL